MLHPDYDYNGHCSSRGNKKSDRRWRSGTAGNQTDSTRVTSHKDKVSYMDPTARKKKLNSMFPESEEFQPKTDEEIVAELVKIHSS